MSVLRLEGVTPRLVISAKWTKPIASGLQILPAMWRKVAVSPELLILPLIIDLVLPLRHCKILQQQFVKSNKAMRNT